jgi:hypothetical protein
LTEAAGSPLRFDGTIIGGLAENLAGRVKIANAIRGANCRHGGRNSAAKIAWLIDRTGN